MAGMRPTMHDVAARAGVSLKTVSRVINDEPRVSPETVQRVRDAIVALNFRRNDMAHHLRKGQSSSTLGLVIEDVSNPFYSAIARGVEEVARWHHYMVITGSSAEEPQLEQELVMTLCRRRVDGLFIVPAAHDHSYLRPEIEAGTRVVFLDRPPINLDADTVVLDNRGGARAGVARLIAEGHRRIGLIAGMPAVYTGAERIAGYREALDAAGLPFDPALLRLEVHDTAQAQQATHDLLSMPDPPTAIFATNNRLSVGVIRAIHDGAPPVAVLGFDDFELADMLRVPITVIRHDPVTVGRRGAELLFARLAGDGRPTQYDVLPTEVVVRGSAVAAESRPS